MTADPRPKTVFIDIDGTLLHHYGSGVQQSSLAPKVLPGALEKLDEWDRKGYRIILVTGRRESERRFTEAQLHSVGIVYDLLIMGIGGGQRVMVNDTKPDSDAPTAAAVCVKRNRGLLGVDL